MNEKDQVTVEALEGDWLVEEGSWGDFHWGERDFRIKMSKETMTFFAPFDSSTRQIALRGRNFFQQWGVMGTPLRYQIESRNNPAEFKINFRFPNLFAVRSRQGVRLMGGMGDEVGQKQLPEIMREGLLRLQGNLLEMAIACHYDGKLIDKADTLRIAMEEQKTELLPRPKDFTPGMQSFVLKLRRATPLDRMQGWWNWTEIHEVTGQPGASEYFVVRNDKSVFVNLGEPTPPPNTFVLKQRGSQLIYTETGPAIYQLDLQKDYIVTVHSEKLFDVKDQTLRMAEFGKVVDVNKYPKLGQGTQAYIGCLVPEGAIWENLKQYERDYIIKVKEYSRSSSGMLAQQNKDNVLGARPSKENMGQTQPGQNTVPSNEKPQTAATTVQRIFRIDQSEQAALKNLKSGDVVQLMWTPKTGTEAVMVLDHVVVQEVAKLGAGREKGNEQQLAVTLVVTRNESRMLDLLIDGGRYQVKIP